MLINYPFDILTISETQIDSTISDSEIHINGYTIIRKDRTKNGGGIAFYIKNTLSYSDRNDLIPDSENLEIVCVEINKRYCTSFLISNWYRVSSTRLSV